MGKVKEDMSGRQLFGSPSHSKDPSQCGAGDRGSELIFPKVSGVSQGLCLLGYVFRATKRRGVVKIREASESSCQTSLAETTSGWYQRMFVTCLIYKARNSEKDDQPISLGGPCANAPREDRARP